MPDWLNASFDSDSHLSLATLSARLGAAFVLGCIVAGIYRLTKGRAAGSAGSEQTASILATLVLLAVLIAMTTIVIGNNVARAFSIVGTLSIVRFRTVVEDTRDTAFVIFAVAVGMAVGAGYLLVPLVCTPIAAAAAFAFRPHGTLAGVPYPSLDFVLTIRLGAGFSADALTSGPFREHLERSNLTTMATARQGAAYEHSYSIRLRRDADAPALFSALRAVEGVQSVELRRV